MGHLSEQTNSKCQAPTPGYCPLSRISKNYYPIPQYAVFEDMCMYKCIVSITFSTTTIFYYYYL